MRECCDQHPKQSSRFTSVRSALPRFDGCTDVLIQDLRIGLNGIEKGCDRLGVCQQSFTPLLRLVQDAFLFCATVQECVQLLRDRRRLNIAHDFANKLQLATSGFMIFWGKTAVGDQRFSEFLGVQLQPLKLTVWQFHKLCTQGLQRMHVTFSSAFRGTVIVLKSGFMLI